MKVAELFAMFSVKTDRASVNDALGTVRHMRNNLLAVGAIMGGGGLFAGAIKQGLAFNSQIEQARIQVASMMGIVRKTDMATEMDEASKAVDSLNDRALKLPGTLKDYLQIWKGAAFPILKAGASMKELEEISVATMAAMKTKDVDPGTATRSLMRIYQGNAIAKDRVTVFFAELLGMTVKELNALSKVDKKLLHTKMLAAATSKHVADLLAVQNQSAKGQREEFGERVTRFLGRVTEVLGTRLTALLTRINNWLEKNKSAVDDFAVAIGNGLVDAFEFLGDVINFVIENSDEIKDILTVVAIILGGVLLKAVLAFVGAWAPVFLVVYGLMKLFQLLRDKFGTTVAIIGTLLAVVFGALLLLKFNLVAAAIWRMAAAMMGFRAASLAAGAAGGSVAGGAIAGGALTGGLGPAGVAGGAATTAGKAASFGSKAMSVGKQIPLIGSAIALDELSDGYLGNPGLSSVRDHLKGLVEEGEMNKKFGEFSLENVYRDVQGVAKGQYFGEAFGRGDGKVNPTAAPVVTNTNTLTSNVTFNGITDVNAILSKLSEEDQKTLRHLQNASGGGQTK